MTDDQKAALIISTLEPLFRPVLDMGRDGMKVVAIKPMRSFRPFGITITFETAEEAGNFYAIVNHVDIAHASIGHNPAHRICQAIGEANEGVPDYSAAHDRLHKLLANRDAT
jgi:hypothetical protein